MLQNPACDKAFTFIFQNAVKSHQNLAAALPPLQCSPRIFFISVCRRPRVQTIGGPDDIWLPSSPRTLAAVFIGALFIKTDDARYSMLSAVQCVSGRELAEMPGVLWAACNQQSGCLFTSCWWLFPLVHLCIFLGSLYYQLCNFSSSSVPPISPDRRSRRNHLGVWWVSNPII